MRVTSIKFTATRTGRRAYYFGHGGRWFPMPLAEAELAVATGAAVDVTPR